ncbi:MAG: HEAT repeat domain-containing protein [Phycisphaerales bacterium]|nr:HEAT repeat domain-containing protein [Phycisphaerales bacterium]
MKLIMTLSLGLCLSTALAQSPAAPQPSTGAPSDPLTDLLARIPAQSADAQARLIADLLKLDAAAVKTLCERLVEPGTGDDAKVRMALHGVVLAAGRPDAQARRAEIEGVLLERLGAKPPPGAQDFLLEQLRFIASPACVSAVSALLHDETHATRAAMVLVTVGDDSAKLALRSALAAAGEKTRLPILHALGELGDGEALASLAAGADPQNAELWHTLLFALAASGNPAMADRVPTLLTPTSSVAGAEELAKWYARSCERNAALEYVRQAAMGRAPAGNAATGGAAADAEGRLRAMLAAFSDPADVHVRCAALSLLTSLAGAKAMPDILAATADADAEYQAAAVEAAASLTGEGVTEAMTAVMAGASATQQAHLLGILAKRADASALDACAAQLKSADAAVRLAAIDAVARLGGAQAVSFLLPLFDTDDAAQGKAVQQALFEIRAEETAKLLGEALGAASPRVKVGILDALARRHAVDQAERVLVCTLDAAPEAARAAWKALESLAPPTQVPVMLERFGALTSNELRESAGAAIAAAACRNEDKTGRAALVIAALKSQAPAHQAALLKSLGRIGGPAALAAVREQLKNPQTEIREAAFAAICDWPNAEALGDCLALARTSAEMKDHVLALRGYLRLIEAGTTQPIEERLRALITAIEVSRRADEKKLAFSSLAKLGDERGVEVLKPYVLDPGAGAEACFATVQLADKLIPTKCSAARAALTALQPATLSDPVKAELQRMLEKLAKFEDHITDWYVSGPYVQKDRRGQDLMEVYFPPEDAKAKGVLWREPAPTADPAMAWALDLNATSAVAGDMRAAYLRTRVYSPAAQTARLEVGSDDGIKVWLNGDCVHTNNALRGCTPSADGVEVKLKEGWNDLLLKITNDGGGWFGAARFRGPGGEHLEGVYAKRGFDAQASPP